MIDNEIARRRAAFRSPRLRGSRMCWLLPDSTLSVHSGLWRRTSQTPVLTARFALIELAAWGKRSPHEATCRSIASRSCARTHHVFREQHRSREARSVDRHAQMSRADRRAGSRPRTGYGRSAVVICQEGLRLSHGVAALLRESGASAEVLEGAFAAWVQGGLSLVPESKLPPRNRQGRTVWVTREGTAWRLGVRAPKR